MTLPNVIPDNQNIDDDVRTRIIAAAANLIAAGGPDAVTTRAAAAAAHVQAPTIYRLFGDKSGLLDAVAEHCLRRYVSEKSAREPDPDPVQDLRNGWDMHIAFGLAHPGLFSIMYGDDRPGRVSPAVAAGMEILHRRVRNIALIGRLRVSEARAVSLLHSVGSGTILTLIGQPEEQRDAGLSDFAREAVMSAIVNAAKPSIDGGASEAAAMLKANLDLTSVLTGGERHLLTELLDRIADDEQGV